ncbi:hypothetical protein C8R44DRAFT_856407 [Mycena epipterygia]|nr:hypothetical protein C8R44DRAFT_856407 [Mycena epipterygia]
MYYVNESPTAVLTIFAHRAEDTRVSGFFLRPRSISKQHGSDPIIPGSRENLLPHPADFRTTVLCPRAMPKSSPDKPGNYRNVRFTAEEDKRLVKFLTVQDKQGTRRFSKTLFAVLGHTASTEFAWSRHRPWQSWMARYKNNRFMFERAIKQYIAHRNGDTTAKRPAEIHARLPTAPPVIKTVRKPTTLTVELSPPRSRLPTAPQGPPSNKCTQEMALATLKSHLEAEQAAQYATTPRYHRRELAHPSYPPRTNMISTLTSDPSPPGTSVRTGLSAALISPPRGATSLEHVAGNSDPATMPPVKPPSNSPVDLGSHPINKTPSADTPLEGALPPNPDIQAAQAQAKLHRKLARMARRTKTFSVDRAWAVYAQMGSIERTRELLDGEMQVQAAEMHRGEESCEDPEAGTHAQVHTELVWLARKANVFSVNHAWAIYARTGSVSRTGEILAAMECAVRDVDEEDIISQVKKVDEQRLVNPDQPVADSSPNKRKRENDGDAQWKQRRAKHSSPGLDAACLGLISNLPSNLAGSPAAFAVRILARKARFTSKEDNRLANFIWTHAVYGVDRGGRKLYEVLGPQASDEFAWSRDRSAASWRNRYKSNAFEFNSAIAKHERQVKTPPRQPTAPPIVKAVSPTISRTKSGPELVFEFQPPPVLAQISPPPPPPSADAQTMGAVHTRLAKAARKSIFSVDFVWTVYADTGSVEKTKVLLNRMAAAADAVRTKDSGSAAESGTGAGEKRAGKRKREHTNDDTGKAQKKRNFSAGRFSLIDCICKVPRS